MAGGQSVTGIGYGGAILCENGSSPTFSKCVIENCTVIGAWGGDGLSGYAIAAGRQRRTATGAATPAPVRATAMAAPWPV